MADDPKAPPAPHRPHLPFAEEWSSISPGDLGLRAIFWQDDSKTSITSRPIVGWVTFVARMVTDVIPKNGFAAVVIADWWLPALASLIPRYACIAPKDATDAEVLARMQGEWKMTPNPTPNSPLN